VGRHLEHLRRRGAGEMMTTAAWFRHVVATNLDYRKEWVVTEACYD
ncbi:unnamed protein product, partial [Scytosiphon promiscuus]